MNDMGKKLPLNPKIEIFRWGPVPGRYFYNSDYVFSMFPHVPKPWDDVAWPKSLFLFNGGKMMWLNEFPELREWGTFVFKKYIEPKDVRENIKQIWRGVVSELHERERKIESLNFKTLSDGELLTEWKNFYDLLQRFWAPTILQEGGNYGSAHYLESKLKQSVPEKEISHVMEILTAPEGLSFYQEEEIDLAETKDILSHQQRYYWLQNSYAGTMVLPVSFFEKRKVEIPSDIRAEIELRNRKTRAEKEAICRKYNLSAEVMNISEGLCDGIMWQDERKRNIWMYLHHKEMFIAEIARRNKIEIDGLRNLGCHEVLSLLGGKSHDEIIKSRRVAFGLNLNGSKIDILTEEQTLDYWDIYTKEDFAENLTEFKGIVASKGHVRGFVRIVPDPRSLEQFKKGEILVAPMTSPEYVFAMKLSSAIITDTGGLTSHAAVTSRELGIPCIIGTKIATKVLRDGMMVEVDAERGVVKIIK